MRIGEVPSRHGSISDAWPHKRHYDLRLFDLGILPEDNGNHCCDDKQALRQVDVDKEEEE